MQFTKSIKFIDLFAGIGGIRKGFELACSELGIKTKCVFTSEIKPHAVDVLQQNYPNEEVKGDITKIETSEIPEFDFLLGGFPCQAFSAAGKRLGFEDTRGTLFFEVERILRDKKPKGFILENVEGLVNHDKQNPKDKIGKTLSIILDHLSELGYKVNWKVLNAKDFGVPQDRKRIYITGTYTETPDLENFEKNKSTLSNILEKGLPVSNSKFVQLVLSHYSVEQLYGMSIKDKRGGENNIHSWDIDYKGKTTKQEKDLLNLLLKERRKKKWATEYGIEWMDGMPLAIDMIRTFYNANNLEAMLEDLVSKKYLKKEYPKKKVGNKRIQDESLPLGYNIVAGKMSYEVSKVLNPNDIAPTLVAMDMEHLFVVDGKGIRKLSLREGLRLFGYPDDFKFNVSLQNGYDLLGNTVVVPVIKQVALRVLKIIFEENKKNEGECA
ncbi:MAG: DNA cytosine methyltransferase [Spirochaetaceae bacterium]|nr:DNA cytosine methyltransferase [Spirochaetaceae bacterium]